MSDIFIGIDLGGTNIKIGCFDSDIKLAELWELSPNTISTWRKRNSIPYKNIVAFCDNEGVSLDYIFTGKGQINRKPEKNTPVAEDIGDRQLPAAVSVLQA